MSAGRLEARISALTHRGVVRTRNEDTIAVESWIRSASMNGPYTVSFPLVAGVVCLVADGMGGHAAGHIASDLAARTILAGKDGLLSADDVSLMVASAGDAIYQAMTEHPEHAGMGTTIAGLVLQEDRVIWFNVGDSPVFSYSNGFLRQRSIDDVSQGHDGGTETRSRAITQSLGGTLSPVAICPHVGVDEGTPEPGTRFLLCSDGITDMLSLRAIEAASSDDDMATVEALFSQAMKAGGIDNISIVLVSIERGKSE